jgi:hypothetical protein
MRMQPATRIRGSRKWTARILVTHISDIPRVSRMVRRRHRAHVSGWRAHWAIIVIASRFSNIPTRPLRVAALWAPSPPMPRRHITSFSEGFSVGISASFEASKFWGGVVPGVDTMGAIKFWLTVVVSFRHARRPWWLRIRSRR